MKMHESLALPDSKPLYSQVKDILIQRINNGVWSPGQALPSEMSLAAELGVSQGTVRKALNALGDLSIIERRQGKGTYVVEHTSSQVLFKFFQVHENEGQRLAPGTGMSNVQLISATKDIASSLEIEENDVAIEINRIRTHEGIPFMEETIFLPEALFKGLNRTSELPNTLYDFYQKQYSITVNRVVEKLSATAANKRQAEELNVLEKHPLLVIDRLAYDLEEKPVERRISNCLSDNLKYFSILR